MTAKKQTAAQARADQDAATAAIGRYFDGLAAEAQATIDKATVDLAAATIRRRQLAEGDRLTRNEAMLVYGTALTHATELAQQLLNGKPVSHEEYDQAKADAEAARRGLLAGGYDLPDTSANPRRR